MVAEEYRLQSNTQLLLSAAELFCTEANNKQQKLKCVDKPDNMHDAKVQRMLVGKRELVL